MLTDEVGWLNGGVILLPSHLLAQQGVNLSPGAPLTHLSKIPQASSDYHKVANAMTA